MNTCNFVNLSELFKDMQILEIFAEPDFYEEGGKTLITKTVLLNGLETVDEEDLQEEVKFATQLVENLSADCFIDIEN